MLFLVGSGNGMLFQVRSVWFILCQVRSDYFM